MPDARVDNVQRTEVLDLLNRALDARSLPLAEYDRRVAAVGTATYASELNAQLDGLPDIFRRQPHPVTPAARPRGTGTAALVLGLLSLPLSMCLVGWIFGILAILYSRRGPAKALGAAMIGRVFGVVGILLSLGAALAVWFART